MKRPELGAGMDRACGDKQVDSLCGLTLIGQSAADARRGVRGIPVNSEVRQYAKIRLAQRILSIVADSSKDFGDDRGGDGGFASIKRLPYGAHKRRRRLWAQVCDPDR